MTVVAARMKIPPNHPADVATIVPASRPRHDLAVRKKNAPQATSTPVATAASGLNTIGLLMTTRACWRAMA
jgi:hypothetical protein